MGERELRLIGGTHPRPDAALKATGRALLGRQSPDLPCEVLFTDLEIEVLTAIGERRRDLKPPRTLGEAVHLVARLGGYLPRKTPPGHKALWSGNVKLRLLCAGYLVGRQDRERGL